MASALWIGFALLFVYAVLIGGGYTGIDTVGLRLASLLIVTLVLLGWAVAAWRLPGWRPGTAIWPALVAPLGALALSTVLSDYPRLGVEYLAWGTLLVALYLLLVRVMGTGFARRRIGGLAAMVGGIIGLAYLGIVGGRWLEWWDALGRIAMPPLRPGLADLPFGGPNIVASAVVLLTVVAVAGIGFAGRTRRITLMVLVTITAAVLFVSGSRSAWLATGGAVVVVGGIWLLLNRHALASRLGDRRWWAVLAATAVGLAAAAIALGPTMLDRLLNAGDGGRPSYFAAAARMFEEAPLAGLGPGNWAARRIAYLEPGDLDYTVPHAHDIYLQTAAELGSLGLLAGTIAVAAILWLVARALRSDDRHRRAWAWATLFGLVYLGVVNLVDFYANLPGVVVAWVIALAVLDARSDRGLGLPRGLWPTAVGRLAVGALGLGCAASIVLLGWAESSALASARATQHANAGDWAAATVAAREAAASDPSHPQHRLMLALGAMHERDWEAARAAYEDVLAIDDLPQAWLGLALATLESGGPAEEVATQLEAALRMGRQHPGVSYAVASLYDRLGQTEAADAAYVEALVRLPALASDPAWRSDPMLRRRFDGLLDRAVDQAGPAGWYVALMAGDAEQARDAVGSTAGVMDAHVADVIAAWEGDLEALARVRARADADPAAAGLLTTAATLLARTGDEEGAARFRQLALTTTEGVTTLDLPVRAASSCEGGGRVPSSVDLYGRWAYRRPTPSDLMPPGLPCLVVADGAGSARDGQPAG